MTFSVCVLLHSVKETVNCQLSSVTLFTWLTLLSLCRNATNHGATQFITGCKHLSHHCILYTVVSWPSLYKQQFLYWRPQILHLKCYVDWLFKACIPTLSFQSIRSLAKGIFIHGSINVEDLSIWSCPVIFYWATSTITDIGWR